MTRTRLGFANYMIGSNIEATRYSGISTRRVITLIYVLSGAMCALAGIVMMARFNSVRVGHGESYILITVLACFLGGVNPFGGFGKVVSVFLALVILQLLSSGLNLMGASQHLATAIWGIMLVGVMILRWAAGQLNFLESDPMKGGVVPDRPARSNLFASGLPLRREIFAREGRANTCAGGRDHSMAQLCRFGNRNRPRGSTALVLKTFHCLVALRETRTKLVDMSLGRTMVCRCSRCAAFPRISAPSGR